MVLKTKSTGIPQNIVMDVVIRTLRSKIEEINQKLNNLYENMRYFEKKYGMKTEEFYKQFVSGKLGDDMDFFEWKASAEIYNELKEEKRVLIEAI
ncbi:MAG: hypothetical protein KJ714_01500 [Euryarchaeota archaeon]|nr:hypothetical protein [Euryarchaeota archaeon]